MCRDFKYHNEAKLYYLFIDESNFCAYNILIDVCAACIYITNMKNWLGIIVFTCTGYMPF